MWREWWGRGMPRLLVSKPKGKRPLESPRRSWVDDIEMDLIEIGWTRLVWLGAGTSGELLYML
jgi:hypothetical protein